MGFAEGLQAGANLVLSSREADRADKQQQFNNNLAVTQESRAEKQQRLTALQNGYTQDEQGNWAPTDLQQQKQTAEGQRIKILQEQLAATQKAVEAQNSSTNAKALADITSSWVNGDAVDAIKTLRHTPELKQALQNAKSLDFNGLDIVNFNNPEDVDKLVTMGVNRESMKDPEVQQALSRSFMKVQGKDGKTRLLPVDHAINQTNSYQFYTKQQRDMYAQSRSEINNVIKGALPQTTEVEKNALTNKNDILIKQNDDMKAYFEANPDKTYSDYKNSQVSGSDKLDLLQKSLNIQSKKLEVQGKTREAAIANYVGNNANAFFTELSNSDLDSTTRVNGQPIKMYQVAKQVQGKNKLSNTRRDYLDGMMSTISNISRLKTKLSKSDFDWNALAKGMDQVSKITGTEWRSMSSQEKANMLKRFSFDSDLRTVMAGYIKAMSGAAVSDEERTFYENAIQGGNWSTKEAALASMKGFESGVSSGYSSALNSMKYNLPATYLEYKSQFSNAVTPKSEVTKQQPTTFTQDKVAAGFKKLFPGVDSITNLSIEQKQQLVDYLKKGN